jgi:hypothetical protein
MKRQTLLRQEFRKFSTLRTPSDQSDGFLTSSAGGPHR